MKYILCLIAIALTGCTYQAFNPEGVTRQWSVSLGNKDQSAGPAGASIGTNATFIKDGIVDVWNSPTTQMAIQGALASQGMRLDAENATLKAEIEALKAEIARLKAVPVAPPVPAPIPAVILPLEE